MTKNGLRISTGYVIPTIPDIVSTWGIYQIVDNVHRFANDIGMPIPALGIVATKVQANNLHNRVIADLRARRLGQFAEEGGLPQPPLFTNVIPQTVAVPRGMAARSISESNICCDCSCSESSPARNAGCVRSRLES